MGARKRKKMALIWQLLDHFFLREGIQQKFVNAHGLKAKQNDA